MALTKEWRHRIMAWRLELSQNLYQPLGPVMWEAAFTEAQLLPGDAREQLAFRAISPGELWGAKWEVGWFRSTLTLPEVSAGQMIALMPDVGRRQKVIMELAQEEMKPAISEDVAEAAVYLDGVCVGAIDEQHRMIFLTDSARPGARFDILLEAYAGHGPREWRSGPTPPDRESIPEPPEKQNEIGESHFGIWFETVYQLMMDVETLWDLREHLDPNSLRVMMIDDGLKDFSLLVDFEAERPQMLASCELARERLRPLLEAKNGDTTPRMVGFGHAHIDVAWLWPLEETVRKCVRTFSTQLALMERYPSYCFLQSQPQLYQFIKDRYPELYAKIKDAIARGQWIADGSAWVEPDTNITGGESLIRQLIHGKRFYQEEFGISSELLWLPDVFGYSGALPQIMRGCGVQYFSTQKIFWAYHGGAAFPYNTFIWEGIDGSAVKAHFHNDYNSQTNPAAVIDRWQSRVQKDGFSSRLFPFGWGDGGGGPTRDHLEYVGRESNLEGVPQFRMAPPMDFFRAQDEAGWPDARYVGELYFQAHRGTYTSQARTKALNRRCEFALREAELWGSTAQLLADFDFPLAEWDAAWKSLLMNQFHDILPGSSIHRVYEEAERQLKAVGQTAQTITDAAQQALTGGMDGLSVFNSLAWPRKALITLPDEVAGPTETGSGQVLLQQTEGKKYVEIDLPACGWTEYQPSQGAVGVNRIAASQDSLENDLIRVEFNELGEITSLFDKSTGQQWASENGNQFRLFQDIPSAFDAWDIDSMYRLAPVALEEPAEIAVLAEGPLFGQLRVRRKINHSMLTQIITLRRDSRELTFDTEIDWQERHKLLKVAFPVNVMAREALHEIQFGHLARPTHRSRQFDQDRYEVSQQKWTALVEADRGFAVLNDSKYGVDVLDNCISLTLLKAPLAPDMTADLGLQRFKYGVYFWYGSLAESQLVQKGYEMNVPAQVVPGSAGSRSLFSVEPGNIILETIKPPEDHQAGAVVVRLYESLGTHTQGLLATSLPFAAVDQTDMLEQSSTSLVLDEGKVLLNFRPFEIKTLRFSS